MEEDIATNSKIEGWNSEFFKFVVILNWVKVHVGFVKISLINM